MPSDPADLTRTVYDAINALTVARTRTDLMRRRLATLAGDLDAIDANLATIRAALDRLWDDLRVITDVTVTRSGSRGSGGGSE
jgi:hypothetical protein